MELDDWTQKTIRKHLKARERYVAYEELLRLTKLSLSKYKVKIRIILNHANFSDTKATIHVFSPTSLRWNWLDGLPTEDITQLMTDHKESSDTLVQIIRDRLIEIASQIL